MRYSCPALSMPFSRSDFSSAQVTFFLDEIAPMESCDTSSESPDLPGHRVTPSFTGVTSTLSESGKPASEVISAISQRSSPMPRLFLDRGMLALRVIPSADSVHPFISVPLRSTTIFPHLSAVKKVSRTCSGTAIWIFVSPFCL